METPYRPFSEAYGFFRRIWQSIFPAPLIPRKEAERKRYLIQNLIFHFRPPTVSEKILRFSLTWGLGGVATVLVILQFATGLLHLHPTLAVCVIPFIPVTARVCIPYLNYPVTTEGIWFASRRGRNLTLFAAFAALIITPALVITDDVIIKPALWFSGFTPVIRGGLIPTVVLLAVISGFFLIVKKGWAASKNEAVQAVFMLLVTAFVVLTILGVLFRGPEMKLILPL